jgi:CBS domain containing-hemolysin-like protein
MMNADRQRQTPSFRSIGNLISLVWIAVVSAVLSGYFSLAGYSLREGRRVQLEEAFSGPRGKRRLAAMDRHFTSLRLTTAFCRSFMNLVLVISMLYLLEAPQHGWERVVWAAVVAGGIIAILGVAIPHAWAHYAGERFLAATFPVLTAARWLLLPCTTVMRAFDVPVRRLSGVSETAEEPAEAAKQEILQAASEGQAEGTVEAEQVEMIESVMKFGGTDAGKVMTPRTDIVALPADTPWQEACRQIFQAGHTRVPVYDGDLDNIIGILYAKDLLRHVGEAAPPAARQIMRKPFFVPETKPLDDLLREFKARKVHIAVVLDEYGGTAGLVSIEDLLEEIVGEIADEYDRSAPTLMHRIDDRTAEVDGRLNIDDLNDAMGLHVPEDKEYDTVAGMVFSELGYIPTAGEKLDAHGARFTIVAADERRITKLRVELLKEAPGSEDA